MNALSFLYYYAFLYNCLCFLLYPIIWGNFPIKLQVQWGNFPIKLTYPIIFMGEFSHRGTKRR
nr:MAG TPA: hypothetical protein [Caudoviricetes sp.]